MNQARFYTITAVAILSFAKLSPADSPVWLPVKQDSQISLRSPLPDVSESPTPDRLHPSEVFSSSAELLIQTSSAGTENECCEGMDGLSGSAHTPTWVQFTPYVWATAVNGDITVDGITAPMNLDLSDLWQMLVNGEVRGGFMGHLGFGRDS